MEQRNFDFKDEQLIEEVCKLSIDQRQVLVELMADLIISVFNPDEEVDHECSKGDK